MRHYVISQLAYTQNILGIEKLKRNEHTVMRYNIADITSLTQNATNKYIYIFIYIYIDYISVITFVSRTIIRLKINVE